VARLIAPPVVPPSDLDASSAKRYKVPCREAFVPKKNRPVIMHCTMNAAQRFCFMMAADSVATLLHGEQ
jgi:hypothetical protein